MTAIPIATTATATKAATPPMIIQLGFDGAVGMDAFVLPEEEEAAGADIRPESRRGAAGIILRPELREGAAGMLRPESFLTAAVDGGFAACGGSEACVASLEHA